MALKIGSDFAYTILVGAPLGGASESRKIYTGSNLTYAKPFVTFDEQSGTPDSTNRYVWFGMTYTTMPSPTKSGYSLLGWYTASSGGSQILASTIVTNGDDHTLYAQWQYVPAQPTITYYNKTATSISFYVTNNSPYSLNVYYEHSDNTPDLAYVTLAANTQSSLLTISGLTPSTSYTIYAQANKDGNLSTVSSITQTTLANTTSAPTINTPYLTTSWRYTVKNNDALAATILSDYNGTNPPTTSRGSVASGANSAVINTGYAIGGWTIYATAEASGKSKSPVTSYYVS